MVYVWCLEDFIHIGERERERERQLTHGQGFKTSYSVVMSKSVLLICLSFFGLILVAVAHFNVVKGQSNEPRPYNVSRPYPAFFIFGDSLVDAGTITLSP